jgi:hypothetical protein
MSVEKVLFNSILVRASRVPTYPIELLEAGRETLSSVSHFTLIVPACYH